MNVVGSLIATSVNCGVYLQIGREVAVPATKSFSSQISVLTMVAIQLSKIKDSSNSRLNTRISLKNSLRMLPVVIGETIKNVDQSIQ